MDIGGRVLLTETSNGMAPLALGDGLRFVGPANLVDYRSPLGPEGGAAVAAAVGALSSGRRYVFDSLPGEAARAIGEALESCGRSHRSIVTEHTNVLRLPASVDDYRSGLATSTRSELDRHSRRMGRELGTPELVGGNEDELFDAFVSLHQGSAGEKGRFMTPEIVGFFSDLIQLAGWRVEALVIGRAVAAAAFGCRHHDGYFLYNIAYDPLMAHLSPGLALITELIAACITEGMSRFDMLKGREEYKLRLGAKPRKLYTIEGVV